MKTYLISFISGLIFAFGLGISGMMNPIKVQGFLDLLRWDPSLTLVMGGAVAVTFVFFPLIFKRKAPILASGFSLPTNNKIDIKLLGGAVLFGAGWAISGLCPGPAIANTATLNLGVLVYLVAMIVGFYLYQNISLLVIRKKDEGHPDDLAKDLKDFSKEQCLVD